jgi:hypothetical protein
MIDYKPFAITNFRTGFDEAVEPWLLPRDAFQRMVNAHLYRGVVQKILGYRPWANMSYRNLIVLTPAPDGVTTVFTGTLSKIPNTTNFYGFGEIVMGTSAATFAYLSDASPTLINLSSTGGSGIVDLTALTVQLTFAVPPSANPYATVIFAWDAAPINPVAIMGIKPYFNSNGGQTILIFDQHEIGVASINQGILAQPPNAPVAISEVPHDYYQAAVFTGNGATLTFSSVLNPLIAGVPVQPGTVEIFEYTPAGVLVRTLTDNGLGALQGTDVNSTVSFFNYGTDAYTITFTVAPANGNTFDFAIGVYGNDAAGAYLFHSSISDFFSLVNYQYKAFFTNNVDPIFYYDGVKIRYLNTNLEPKLITSTAGAPNNLDITKTLHVTVQENFLLLLSPTYLEGGPQVSTIQWSKQLFPLDFTNDQEENASTSQPIRTFSFINTDLIVRFSNSERIFRFTADVFDPFRFELTNNNWACDAPYTALNYDSWFASVGRPAITGSDGVNVKRVDEIIPDFTDPKILAQQTPIPYMSQTSIKQCYGERFDDLKEGWICYNSLPKDENGVVASDNVLSFNYLDETYAVYSFPFSCLGIGTIINVPTWSTTYTTWEEETDTWDDYDIQTGALQDLAGDQFDTVYQLNSGNSLTLAGDETQTPFPVLIDCITKNFNPFIEDGQLCRFGYLDLFVSAYNTTTLRVQFFLNDQLYVDSSGTIQGFYQESILTFTDKDAMSPTSQQTKVWKRIYVGAVGKEHTIRFYQNEDDFETNFEQPVYIHSMVLNMKPAGRIFN